MVKCTESVGSKVSKPTTPAAEKNNQKYILPSFLETTVI